MLRAMRRMTEVALVHSGRDHGQPTTGIIDVLAQGLQKPPVDQALRERATVF